MTPQELPNERELAVEIETGTGVLHLDQTA